MRSPRKVRFLGTAAAREDYEEQRKIEEIGSGDLPSESQRPDSNQMIEKRTKPRKIYKVEEVLNPDFLETKPHGVRHGAIDAEESTWENMPELEILEGSMPQSSDLLIDSVHQAIVGALKPMRGTGY